MLLRTAFAASLAAFAFIAAPVAAGAPAAQPAERTDPTALAAGAPQPAIWLLSDEDTRIWMFGTSHVLPYDFAWRSPELDAIIAEVDELVLETADQEAAEKPGVFERMMRRDEPFSILSRISPEYRLPLQGIIKDLPITLEDLDELETWAVGFLLIGIAMYDELGDPHAGPLTGVEDQLTAIFNGEGKPISAVETSFAQVDFLSSISPEGQREFLEGLIEAATDETSPQQQEEMIRDPWVTGNIEQLGRECDNEENFPPELHEILLRQRNLNWAEWVEERMTRPGDILFAVGACHLAGSVSLQSMLTQRGYTIERVE